MDQLLLLTLVSFLYQFTNYSEVSSSIFEEVYIMSLLFATLQYELFRIWYNNPHIGNIVLCHLFNDVYKRLNCSLINCGISIVTVQINLCYKISDPSNRWSYVSMSMSYTRVHVTILMIFFFQWDCLNTWAEGFNSPILFSSNSQLYANAILTKHEPLFITSFHF